MKITNKEDVKVGHWITFRSQSTDWPTEERTIQRKFYEVQSIDKDSFYCKTYVEDMSNKRPIDFYDTIIDRLFENPDGDEVYETFQECKLAYAEEFI